MIYPWQTKQWQQIWQAKQEGRLPHALLFAGISGVGKKSLAEHLAAVLLCQHVNTEGVHCKQCPPCRLMAANTHPNYFCVTPEKDGAAIKVDQIREVIDFVNQSSLQGEHRIVLISPADDMNINAANALLKTLEEPSQGALLILLSNQPSQLPATILSRCQRIAFSQPNQTMALQWLQDHLKSAADDAPLLLSLANGAPLAALNLAESDILSARKILFTALSKNEMDASQTANGLKDVEIITFTDFMLSWLTDLMRLQLHGANITNIDFTDALHSLAKKIPLLATTKLLEYVLAARGNISRGINFNKTLYFEDILLRWRNISHGEVK